MQIEISDDACKSLISSGRVGVGQLFRHLGILPYFTLHAAGKTADGELWRDYELSCDRFRCRFIEIFHPQLLTLSEESSENWTPNDQFVEELTRSWSWSSTSTLELRLIVVVNYLREIDLIIANILNRMLYLMRGAINVWYLMNAFMDTMIATTVCNLGTACVVNKAYNWTEQKNEFKISLSFIHVFISFCDWILYIKYMLNFVFLLLLFILKLLLRMNTNNTMGPQRTEFACWLGLLLLNSFLANHFHE